MSLYCRDCIIESIQGDRQSIELAYTIYDGNALCFKHFQSYSGYEVKD